MKVKNLQGSGENFPKPTCKCASWIAHWNINKYPNRDKIAGYCRGCGKKLSNSDLLGGHVIKTNPSYDVSRYIIPLCSSCNGKDYEEFDVKEDDLISANCDNCINR